MDAGPSTWWRYIDDILAIWPHNEEQLTEFLEKINQFHSTINFMAEWSQNLSRFSILSLG